MGERMMSFTDGHSRSEEFTKIENGRLVFYGYRIDYDKNKKEISRTEPKRLSSMGWSDGSGLTSDDLKKLEG